MMDKPSPRSLPVAVLLTALVAFGPISTDLYLPSLPDMTRAFDTEVARVQLTLSAFIAGFALGMLVYGPLSDKYGRRPVLLGGVALYMVASVACLLAPSIEGLIAARFVQALGACAGPVVARAVVRDVYDRDEAARMLSYMASAMAIAPAIGPILGGWLHTVFGWQANFAALALFGVLVLTATALMLRETNQTRDPNALHPVRMASTYWELLRSRLFVGYTLVVGLTFGGLFSFISGSSFVLIDVLHVKPAHFGFAFAVVVLGYMSGAFLSARLVGKVGLDRVLLIGLCGTVVASWSGAALILLGVEHLASVLGPLSITFFFCALVIPNGTAGAITPYPRIAGSVSSLLGFLQMALGATCGALVGLLHDDTIRPMMMIIAGAMVLALISFWFLVRRPDEAPSA